MKLFKRIKAKLNNVPFNIDGHWQQYYPICGYKFLKDKSLTVILFDVDSRVGDVVDVLKNDNVIHKYTIKKVWYAKGGDWGGFSNQEHWLEYHSTSKIIT